MRPGAGGVGRVLAQRLARDQRQFAVQIEFLHSACREQDGSKEAGKIGVRFRFDFGRQLQPDRSEVRREIVGRIAARWC